MKKKLLWTIIPIVLIIGIAITYFEVQYPRMTFEELLGTEEYNITKVLVKNPVTGVRVETENKERIMELINLFNDRTYRKNVKQIIGHGYIYASDFYSGDKMVLSVIGTGYRVHIYNETRTIDAYYNVSKELTDISFDNWVNSFSNK